MNSLITLRWKKGGRKVCSATSQRGGKIRKSQLAVPAGWVGEGVDAGGDDRDVARARVQGAELGAQQQPPLLRHDQEFAVGVVKYPVGHRAGGAVEMDADAAVRARVAVGADRRQALDEIGRL